MGLCVVVFAFIRWDTLTEEGIGKCFLPPPPLWLSNYIDIICVPYSMVRKVGIFLSLSSKYASLDGFKFLIFCGKQPVSKYFTLDPTFSVSRISI